MLQESKKWRCHCVRETVSCSLVLFRGFLFFDVPEVMCARSSFCHLQPGILCPTHKMELIEGCPLAFSFLWIRSGDGHLFPKFLRSGLSVTPFHPSQGLSGCFIHESQSWDSKVRLRLEVPPIYLLQSINSGRPAAVYTCAFQELPYTSVSWRKRIRKFKFWHWFAKYRSHGS